MREYAAVSERQSICFTQILASTELVLFNYLWLFKTVIV